MCQTDHGFSFQKCFHPFRDPRPGFGIQEGYSKVDLRLQLEQADDSWFVALIGKNLTDEITTGSAFNLPQPITAVSRAIYYIEPPRTVAIEAGVRF